MRPFRDPMGFPETMARWQPTNSTEVIRFRMDNVPLAGINHPALQDLLSE
jgi:hypothetical protein